MHPLLNIAVRAARRAGSLIVRNLDRGPALAVSAKGRNDFVTEVDRMVEAEIVQILRKSYPEHGILAEESGLSPGDDTVWVIDPLDGTTNFLHGFPHFCVSIAAEYRGKAEVAVVPGVAFGDDKTVRLSYATDLETIKTGLDRIEQFCRTI